MKMFDAAPWGTVKLGQIGMYSANAMFNPFGGFYSGPAISPEERILRQSSAQIDQGGGYPSAGPASEPIAAGECFTCTNPDTGDTQFGVSSDAAKGLKGKGYRCRKDNCAQPVAGGGYGRFGSFGGLFQPQAPTNVETGMLTPPTGYYENMLSGVRGIPLAQGLGRRALL